MALQLLIALYIALLFQYHHSSNDDVFVSAFTRTNILYTYHKLPKNIRSACCAAAQTESVITETQQQSQRRHTIFQNTNAVSKNIPIPHQHIWRRSLPNKEESKKKTSFWNSLSSTIHKDHKISINDVSVQFDNPSMGARELLEKAGVIISKDIPSIDANVEEEETIHHLTSVLSYFQSIAGGKETNVKCKARLVSTIGERGIKCPRWHLDHVPVRLIMSIVGLGCEYITEKFGDDDQLKIVNRTALNSLDEEDTQIANDIIVPKRLVSDRAKEGEEMIQQAKEGEAILLTGKGWEEEHDDSSSSTNEDIPLAAVHRSPILKPNQERILLTVDLVDWQ